MNPSGNSVTWLHLSDIHFSRDRLTRFKRVFRALWEDLRTQCAVWQPDFIVVTGDIAQSGVKQEYQDVEKHFFLPLLDYTQLTPEHLFVVPGNHDVNWKVTECIELPVALDSEDAVFEVLGDESRLKVISQATDDYREFILRLFEGYDDHGILRDPLYGYAHSMEVNGVSVEVIGLSSAWVSGFTTGSGGQVADRGNLLVGAPQVDKILEINDVDRATVRIALMHHPFSWLKEFDAGVVRRDLRRSCDFVLHGHMHEPSFIKETVWENETIRIIPAGSILDTSTLRNGYNFVRLKLGAGTGEIWLRHYSEKHDRWVNDNAATGDDSNGRIDFEWP